jgi:beta-mannosidase
MPAVVPGCVHTDLMAAGRIADPLVGMNELDVLWIDEADWEYERTFELDAGFLACRGQWLVCEGLDTVAEIAVNGRPVGRTFNMFRRYRFDVGPHLRAGENVIRIVFRSPVRYGQRQSAALPYELPGTEYAWGTGRTRKVYRPYVRKAQYQFGWDWGPCLATSGIWRDIRLVAADAPQIEYVTTQQHHEAGRVCLTIQAHLLAPTDAEGQLEVSVGAYQGMASVLVPVGESVVAADVMIDSPRMWWPAGFGDPCLYPLTARWVGDDGSELDRATTRIGLRTVELVRQSDEIGQTFFFRINGREVFCKGANWIPADPFPSRVDRARYERLIHAARDAHMNMLRIWGGGIYEADSFYDLCDEHGLMVWQDFMFACAAYPDDEPFLADVSAEVRHQVRRLVNHPSIVLWCGDNENEWGVNKWWHQKAGDSPLRPAYDRLIVDTVAPVVAEEDPGRPWWPSSPSNGGDGEPNDLARGDAHFWEVWHLRKPFERYLEVMPRFCSEFGFQSFPSPATLHTAIDPGVRDINHPLLLHHQRHGQGNTIIGDTLRRLFREPADFDELCFLSQLAHGLALKYGVEHWRRGKPKCMGTLYWQLHDCWVVASWASVDYELRYKAAHCFAKRFFAPLLGSIVDDGSALHLWATSDVPAELDGAWRLETWHVDGRCLGVLEGRFTLPAQGSRCFQTVPLRDLPEPRADRGDRLVRLIVTAGEHHHENLHVFAPYRDLNLRLPTIRTVVTQRADGSRITLTTDVPALFVELDQPGVAGVFSDNYLALFPGGPREIDFAPAAAADVSRPPTVRSLRSAY